MSDIANKVAVITGGNSGIVAAIAKKFDREGAKVAIFGRDPKKLEAVCSTLKNALFVSGDVRKLHDLDYLYKETVQKFGKIDILVANAGVSTRKKIDDVDEALFDAIVDTNYKGVYFTVQRAISSLNKQASVILISSAAAHKGGQNHSVYSSAKAAVSMLARSFSADLIDRGIRVNALSPGFTETPIFDYIRSANPTQLETFKTHVPLKRFADPDEIADAALFLASPRSSYIVGIDLVVDGGASSVYPK